MNNENENPERGQETMLHPQIPKSQIPLTIPILPEPVPSYKTLVGAICLLVASIIVFTAFIIMSINPLTSAPISSDTMPTSIGDEEAENPNAADETETNETAATTENFNPPSANLINTEEIVDPRWRELEAIFMSRYGITASGNPTAAIVAIDLKNPTAHLINVNAEATMHLASVYKVFVAYATYVRIGEGSLSFDTRLATSQTVGYCLDRMLLFSENECAHALGDYLGWTNIENRVAGIGIKINLYGYTTSTAQYLALFLQKLYNNQLLPTYLTDIFIGKLKVQVIRDRIAYALPNKIIADKPGNLGSTLNDVAIVFDPNRETADDYILVILTDGQSIAEIVNIARLVDANFNPPLAE